MDATELVATVRDLIHGPQSPDAGDDQTAILNHADRFIRTVLFPRLAALDEAYGIVRQRFVRDGRKDFAIPSRAFNSQIDSVYILEGTEEVPIDWCDGSERHLYRSARVAYLEGDYIRFTDIPDGDVIVAFPFRPSKLTTEYAVVASGGGMSIAAKGSLPTSWLAGEKFDVSSGIGSAQPRFYGVKATAVLSPTMGFAQAVDGTVYGTRAVEEGDVIARSGYTGVPQVPDGFHVATAYGAAMSLLTAIGDFEMRDRLERDLAAILETQLVDLDRRVERSRPQINYASPFRRIGRGWRGNRTKLV